MLWVGYYFIVVGGIEAKFSVHHWKTTAIFYGVQKVAIELPPINVLSTLLLFGSKLRMVAVLRSVARYTNLGLGRPIAAFQSVK